MLHRGSLDLFTEEVEAFADPDDTSGEKYY
jgi:hypothetical protein